MLSWRTAALLCALALATLSSRARAQPSIHATAEASIAYTDNMMSTTSEPLPGEPEPIPVWFLVLTPGGAFYYDSPRYRFLVTYGHPFTFYFGHSDANSSADIGTMQGIFTLSPRDELTVGLGVQRTTTNLAMLQYGADQAAVTTQPPGASTLLTFDLNQGYSRELSLRWQLLQSAGGSVVVPLKTPEPQPYRYLVRGGLGAEYTFGHNAIAAMADVNYIYHTSVYQEDVEQDAEQQVLWSGRGRYRRDFSPSWSGEASAGVNFAWGPKGGTYIAPIWGAAVRFHQEGYSSELSYRREVTPNVIVGQTYLSDEIRLSGGVPVSREHHLLLSAATGISWNRIIDFNQEIQPDPVNAWVADAAFGWYPDLYPNIVLRYQHFQQFGSDQESTVLPNYHRNLVMLTVSYMFPSRDIGHVPTGPPQRVDGTDRDPLAPGGTPAPGSGIPTGRPAEPNAPAGP